MSQVNRKLLLKVCLSGLFFLMCAQSSYASWSSRECEQVTYTQELYNSNASTAYDRDYSIDSLGNITSDYGSGNPHHVPSYTITVYVKYIDDESGWKTLHYDTRNNVSSEFNLVSTAIGGWIENSSLPSGCPIPPPPENCTQSQIDDAISTCETEDNIEWDYEAASGEFPQCQYTCKNTTCTQERTDLEVYCSGGIKSFDELTCTGKCLSCEDREQEVAERCADNGGYYAFSCDIKDSIYPDEQKNEVTFTCLDAAPNTENPITPRPEPTPETPAPDPTPDPDNTPEENTQAILDAIKQNSDSEVKIGNETVGQLSDLNKNEEKIAENQGIINDNINNLNKTNNQGFKSLKNALKNQKVTIDLSQLKTSATAPEVPEFNSDLPTDDNYTEYDNGEQLATDSATTYAQDNLTYDADSSPIDAEITATGDPCINGNVSLQGHSIPISICFNKPWMLTGYSIMKILMIGIGYLQTAILLNKAIIR